MKTEKEIKERMKDASGGAIILIDSDEDSGKAFLDGYRVALIWVLEK